MNSKIDMLGVFLDNITFKEAENKIKLYLDKNESVKKIFTPNPEIVMLAQKNIEYKKMLNKADLSVVDGIGLVYGAKLNRINIKERVTGYDLSIWMIEELNRIGGSIFIMGGAKGVAEKAVENIKFKYPNIRIAGEHHGFFKGTHIGYNGHDEEKQVINKINNSNADVLFVCLGAYKQEKWICENEKLLNCKIAIGNGGVADVLAGNVKMAPDIWRRLGLEWLYRLKENPSRFKRQLEIPKFIVKILLTKKAVTYVQND